MRARRAAQPRRSRAGVLALAGVLAVAGCSRGEAEAVPDQGYIAGQGTVAAIGAADRDDPVRFAGTTLDGETFDVRDHRGKVVVVNVWASWCPPCIAEAPGLQEVWAASDQDRVQFVGIDTQDNRAAALAHEKRFGVTYPSIDDDGGRTVLSLRGSLSPKAIPSTLVLDRRGRVAARVLGQVPASTLRALVSDALAEKRA